MRSKKLFVIIPDGVSLRNFAYTNFPNIVENSGWDLIYWNATGFELSQLGLKEIKLQPKVRAWTDLLKRAKILRELEHFKERFNDPVYDNYKFRISNKGIKSKIKNSIVHFLIKYNRGEKGLARLGKMIQNSERNSNYYNKCKDLLEKEKPDVVFCASQRPVNAIAPILAAQDLSIPTACFIFSWDNLPKATKVIESENYFVWSEHMKQELMRYYPYIKNDQIRITGTTQFEIHSDRSVILSRNDFFEKYDLEKEKQYLCFSGDDITTSPHDEFFLRDVADEVRKLNASGKNIGIIFRRCPVDYSDRYDKVLSNFQDVIVPIAPHWIINQNAWNEIMPKKEDLILQTNIIEHSFLVINVASSMVFDFALKDKPCAYLNYLLPIPDIKKDVREIYSYVHFRTMPRDGAYWINSKQDLRDIILRSVDGSNEKVVEKTRQWFQKINSIDSESSSSKIVHQLDQLI